MIPSRLIASLAMLATVCADVGRTQEKNRDAIPVKYDTLKQEVLKHRGKVLIVDFWTGT
jgi:hypothetical protein